MKRIALALAIVSLLGLTGCGGNSEAKKTKEYCNRIDEVLAGRASLQVGKPETLLKDFENAKSQINGLRAYAPKEIKADVDALADAMNAAADKIAKADPKAPGGRLAILGLAFQTNASQLIQLSNKLSQSKDKLCKKTDKK